MITTYDVFVKPTMGMGCSKRIGVDLAKAGHKKAFMIYDTYMLGGILGNLIINGIAVIIITNLAKHFAAKAKAAAAEKSA